MLNIMIALPEVGSERDIVNKNKESVLRSVIEDVCKPYEGIEVVIKTIKIFPSAPNDNRESLLEVEIIYRRRSNRRLAFHLFNIKRTYGYGDLKVSFREAVTKILKDHSDFVIA